MGMNFKVIELWREFTHCLQETLQIFDALDSNHDEDMASTCFNNLHIKVVLEVCWRVFRSH